MKALVFQNGKTELREIEPKPLPEYWTRVEVLRAGLCGTDVSKIGAAHLPLGHTTILGHEFVGRVVESHGHAHVSPGQLVAGMPMIACGKCWPCTHGRQHLCNYGQAIGRTIPGAFAELVDLPTGNLSVVDSGSVDPYVLADPLAVCIHATNVPLHQAGLQCLVIGDGTIGVLTAWALRQKGCNVRLLGKHFKNIEFAQGLGIETTDQGSTNEQYDSVFETVGRTQPSTLDLAIKTVRPGGRVTVLGVYTSDFIYSLAARQLFINETELKGSNGYRPEEFTEAVRLIASHPTTFTGFISHRFTLVNAEKAIKTAMEKRDFTMKIIFEQGGDRRD